MATESLGFPTSRETEIFRAAEAVMREDPVLSDRNRVKTWGSMRGQADAAVYAMSPTVAMMPMIRLRPSHGPDQGLTVRTAESVLFVVVEAFTPGLDADDMLNLWGAIREAWKFNKPHRDTTVKCFMDRLKATRFDVKVPGYRPLANTAENSVFLSGVGQIEIVFERPR